MRPYRGLTKDGKWVYGWYYEDEGLSIIINLEDNHDYIVIPETVGQSTGLKDKNGKDLNWWEGDLLREDGGKIMEIIYEDRCFWGVWVKHRENRTRLCTLATWAEAIEIIGNVHQTEKQNEISK